MQVGVLNVVEAPDILYNETSNDTIVAEGASVNLRCEARGFPEPTVTWRREDGAPIVLRNHQNPTRRTRKLYRVTKPKWDTYKMRKRKSLKKISKNVGTYDSYKSTKNLSI